MGTGYTPLDGQLYRQHVLYTVGPACPPEVRSRYPVPTAYITHPSSLLHDMGPYHPECPDRLRAIGDRLISSGLDSYLQHYEAPAATHEQLARVHNDSYLAS